eukprot:TRINITY_DN14163_c0_g1_i4.p2 TRINITY_DN14163_c0_g1~~TRINITY_DN14163_c0_g1_i4.p2  ORF type:complete len:519 (+),score=41.83 TRINITY_DN14163_c0_g1_i4:107-1663(+)
MCKDAILILLLLATPTFQRRLQKQNNSQNQLDLKHEVIRSVTGKTCKFPVEHSGTLYFNCVPDIDGHKWCPVAENIWEKCEDHQFQSQQLKQSSQLHAENNNENNQQQQQQLQNDSFWREDNIGRMTVEGLPCIFPIMYMGEVLYDCVSDVSGFEWCPTLTGSWQRCANSKDWLHEVADKYVNQVDNLMLPNIGGFMPPIVDTREQQIQKQPQIQNRTKIESNIDESIYIPNSSNQVSNTVNLNRVETEPVDQVNTSGNLQREKKAKTIQQQMEPKSQVTTSTLNRKTLNSKNVNTKNYDTQSQKQDGDSSIILITLLAIVPILTVMAIGAFLAENKYKIVQQTKQQWTKKRVKMWPKKHTMSQIPMDVESNQPNRRLSQSHMLHGYPMRSDTQITALKLSSSEGSTITRRHTSNSGHQKSEELKNQQEFNSKQLRPDYHTRRSRSQIQFTNQIGENVPGWIQNTDESFWTDIGVSSSSKMGVVGWEKLPQPWLEALEKVEKTQESRRAQSDSPKQKK